MPYQPSDETREKIAAAGRMAANASRRYGPPLSAWLWKNKAGVVIAFLLVYILWPKSEPKNVEINTSGPVVVSSEQPPMSRPTSQPTSGPATQPTNQYAGTIPLYPTDTVGGDPKWSMPAELAEKSLQDYAAIVNRLDVALDQTSDNQTRLFSANGALFQHEVVDAFWKALLGHGFKDQALPHDWYEAVEEHDDLPSLLGEGVSSLFDGGARATISYRLASLKVRLIGGQLLIGDILFLKTVDGFVMESAASSKKLLDKSNALLTRIDKEFGTTYSRKD